MPRLKKDNKMTQQVLFKQLNKLEEKEKEGQELATELTKVIAEKIPSKKKYRWGGGSPQLVGQPDFLLPNYDLSIIMPTFLQLYRKIYI